MYWSSKLLVKRGAAPRIQQLTSCLSLFVFQTTKFWDCFDVFCRYCMYNLFIIFDCVISILPVQLNQNVTRWQVFHPPDISDVDPLRRGKDGDVSWWTTEPFLNSQPKQ